MSEKPPHRRRIGCLEWGCITLALLVVAAILFPILMKAREKVRPGTCTSNVCQLNRAVMMYSLDHKGRLPGIRIRAADGILYDIGWERQVLIYVKGGGSGGSFKEEMFWCASHKQSNIDMPISYGYSALLLNPDGTGINESSIKSPTQVGVVCDVEPGREQNDGGGLVGGYGLAVGGAKPERLTVTPSGRHSKGCIIGYADGHAAIVPEPFDIHDPTHGITRVFYAATTLGLVDNPAAGMPDFTVAKGCPTPLIVGGDPCTRPLLLSACAAWQRKVAGFTYQDAFHKPALLKRSPNVLTGNATGIPRGKHAIPIARDAVVAIVNKNSTINGIGSPRPVVSQNDLQRIFSSDGRHFTPSAKTPDVQVYTFAPGSDSRQYAERAFGFTIPDRKPGYHGIYCTDDADLVDKVAADPLGIGLCSAAFADQKRVTILAIITPDGRTNLFPADNTSGTAYPSSPAWPFTRTLYVEPGGDAWRADGSGIANVMFAPGGAGKKAFQAGPWFHASYWPLTPAPRSGSVTGTLVKVYHPWDYLVLLVGGFAIGGTLIWWRRRRRKHLLLL